MDLLHNKKRLIAIALLCVIAIVINLNNTNAAENGVPALALKIENGRLNNYKISATQWKSLSTQDWQRYGELMGGPRQYWTPNLDPLLVLGSHAETETERMRLAGIFVDMENNRIDGEVRFQNAVNRVVEQRYAHVAILKAATNANARNSIPHILSTTTTDVRVAMFASIHCLQACTPLLLKTQKIARSYKARLDLFLSDAKKDDAIRQWAHHQDINREAVFAKHIALNHDQGRWLSLRAKYPHLQDLHLPQSIMHKPNGEVQVL